MAEREIERWVTLNGGKRIPIYSGDSKEDVAKRIKSSVSKSGDSKKSAPAKQKVDSKEAPKKSDSDVTKNKPVKNLDKKESPKKREVDKKDDDIKKASERIKSLNDEEKYRDSAKQGNNVTFKNGKAMFKGKEVPKLDTSDAIAEIKGNEKHPGKDNSLAKHLDKDGNLSAERQRVHAEIMQDYFNGVIEAKKGANPVPHQPYAPGDEHVAMFTGGGGASGKGAFSKDIGKFYSQDKNPMVVDPDALKGALLKYDKGKDAKLDLESTGFYHEESSALAKQIYQAALENNYPVMYDGTATGGGVYKLLDMARKNGYKAEMNFIFSDWKTVRQNSLDRLRSTGRFVPPEAQVGAHMKAYKAVTGLQDKFDSFKLWDNAGRNLRPVGESSLGRNLRISNAESWNRFKTSYDDFLLSQEEIDRYYDEADAIDKERRRNSQK